MGPARGILSQRAFRMPNEREIPGWFFVVDGFENILSNLLHLAKDGINVGLGDTTIR
jgi:hypothetical protein